MPELELTEPAEELLSALWTAREEKSATGLTPGGAPSDRAIITELVDVGLVREESGSLFLTKSGETEAAAVVRRERLAERLLADVLKVNDSLATEAACRFEHLLRRGIDNRICTLLGHPRACPHGSPIPPGECCQRGAEEAARIVSSLADLAPGQSGAIAYIQSQRREFLQRLLTMGALPGARIVLRQKSPSFVFDLGHGQVAVDEETAREVYIRVDGGARSLPRRGLVHRIRRLRAHRRAQRS
jgi:DtxR family Mn-dependent transcriptional regulator